MRDDDQLDIEGSQPDAVVGAVYSSVAARRSQRRKQAVVGVTGLVIILGAVGVVTRQVLDDDRATVTEAGGLNAPLDTTTTTAPAKAPGRSVAPSVEGLARAAVRATLSPRPPVAASSPVPASPAASSGRRSAASPTPSTTAERIKAAREQAAKDGFPVQRPLLVPSTAIPAEIRVTQTGSLRTDKRTLKVVSARGDLTGYRELGLVADGGEPVGPAHCTQMFRTSPDAPARRRPTLLVCWRTSATRSVYTVAVNLNGHPSRQLSVAQIDKIWPTLA